MRTVLHRDITTQNSTKCETIRSKIVNCIKEAMNKDKFRRDDIGMVIHLIDTDGIYIHNENVKDNDTLEKYYYTNTNIEAKDVELVIKRNEQKKNILNCLTTMPSIY